VAVAKPVRLGTVPFAFRCRFRRVTGRACCPVVIRWPPT